MFAAFLATVIIVLFFSVVHYYFGGTKKLDTNITSFFGAMLALSGLMTKQYLFKETIDYLSKWIQIEKLIDEILINAKSKKYELKEIENELAKHNNLAASYGDYVKRELRLIPIIPVLLVVLYGAALIACNSVLFRSISLGFMLFLVSYLAKATISSNNLAIVKTDLDVMLHELGALLDNIKEVNSTEPGA